MAFFRRAPPFKTMPAGDLKGGGAPLASGVSKGVASPFAFRWRLFADSRAFVASPVGHVQVFHHVQYDLD